MKKINIFSDFEITKSTLNHPLVKYNPIQYLIKTRYLLALRKNEAKRDTLDLDNRLIAEFNSLPTSLIASDIRHKIIINDKNIFKIMKKEITRLDYVTNEYKNEKLKKITELEMKYLLTGIVNPEELKKIITKLYNYKKNIQNNKKIKFKIKNRTRAIK